MMLKKIVAASLLVIAVTFAGGATGNWNGTVSLTDGGHVVGNPDAQFTLTEWVSYTCPHCAEFAKQADGALAIAYVAPGKMKREYRQFVRDPVDLTIGLLVNCGAVSNFPLNHAAFLYSQDQWLPTIGKANEAQRLRWTTGPFAARSRAIASDFGFYEIMQTRGYSRMQVDRCLTDEAEAKKLAETTQADFKKYDIKGTPSFAINGLVLAGTHDWSLLEPQITARLEPVTQVDAQAE